MPLHFFPDLISWITAAGIRLLQKQLQMAGMYDRVWEMLKKRRGPQAAPEDEWVSQKIPRWKKPSIWPTRISSIPRGTMNFMQKLKKPSILAVLP